MRQTISGVLAAFAVVIASAAPAMACGWYGCSPCGPAYVNPCVASPVYVSQAPVYSYSGCDFGCGGWAYERLPDPVHQYYYVNQGPTYSGPGKLRALSDLSGKRVGVGWLSPSPQAPCAAPLLLTAISSDGSRRPVRIVRAGVCLVPQPIAPSLLAPI